MTLSRFIFSLPRIQAPKEDLNFLIIGDSISAGAGDEIGPTPPIGKVKEWDGSTLIAVTDEDVSSVAVLGSPWPQFGITISSLTKRNVNLVCSGSSGSEFYPSGGGTNHWYTTGSLYTPAKNKALSLLTYKDISKINGVLIILGINDARRTSTLTNIKIGMDSLITRLNTNLSTPNIYIAQIGREEDGDTLKVIDVRNLISNTDNLRVFSDGVQHGLGLVQRYSNVYMAYDQMPDFTSLGYMRSDNLHPNQLGNNAMGAGFANFIAVHNNLFK